MRLVASADNRLEAVIVEDLDSSGNHAVPVLCRGRTSGGTFVPLLVSNAGRLSMEAVIATRMAGLDATMRRMVERLPVNETRWIAKEARPTRVAVQEVASACATDRTDAAPAEVLGIGGKATDPASMPADTTVGRLTTLLTNLKGILMVNDAYLGFGEDASRGVMRVEEQPSYSAETGADLAIVAAGISGRLYGLLYSVTVAAQVILRNDGVVGGSIIKTFDLPVGCNMIPLKGMTYGNGVFLDYVSGTGTFVVLYRDN